MNEDRLSALQALSGRIGHSFVDIGLLHRALTHKSVTNEMAGSAHNEPLEFLGDAVLGFLVADICIDGTRTDQGEKSRARAALVSAASLGPRAATLGLSDLLVLGRGEEKTLFASNPQQAEIIRSDSGQDTLARILAESIRRFFPAGGLVRL